ncbi:putative Disulfide bond formation protein DsbA [Candidatus Xenohaliotis californiensis]|uniref:Disulfide bond formation protein DsbA n=1 Tax=Candidatus Xenohaliotis californiensis TaxID=84677 RepID=A0ABM9N6V9_9RICK|nr:putative Disulfide bond formation protein DsbA [Candidatus Xenohaliotis californiensis]
MKKLLFILIIPICVRALDENLLGLLDGDDFFGSKSAPIIMITYDSVSCPHCAQFNMETIPSLKRKFASDVLFIHRDFPMDKPSLYGTALLECVGVEQARKLRMLLFQSQSKWVFSRNTTKLLDNIYNSIKISGISREKYDKCINDNDAITEMINRKENAMKKIGVFATPTHFINGKKYEGAHPDEFFIEIFEKLLKNMQYKQSDL